MLEAAQALVGQNIGFSEFWCHEGVARILEDAGYPGPWEKSPAWMKSQIPAVSDPQPGDVVFIELVSEGMTPTGQTSHIAIVERIEGETVFVIEGNGSAETVDVIGRGSWPVSQVTGYGRV